MSSTFTNNVATQDGGAIYNIGTIFVGRSSFSSNKTTENGGAIYNDNVNTEEITTLVNVQGSTFSKNTADKGGAIYNASNSKIDIDRYDYVYLSKGTPKIVPKL